VRLKRRKQIKQESKMHIDGKPHTPLIAADKVAGTEVYNTNGDHLGEIDDVMLDKMSGKVAYAIMSFGGFLGMNENYHPLPWSMLTYDTAKGGYVVPVTREQLENAPMYGNENQPDLGDKAYGKRVHDYYGSAPYWGI
jgi:sporulation protein YlmC with PRC-barrel domain